MIFAKSSLCFMWVTTTFPKQPHTISLLPAAQGPEWIPILRRRGFSGWWGMRMVVWTALSKSRDMVAISPGWMLPFRVGNPDATMYASPIVSTWNGSKTMVFYWRKTLNSVDWYTVCMKMWLHRISFRIAALCEENPLITGRRTWQRVSKVELWCFS